MTAARRWLAIAVASLLRMTAALLDAIDPPDGSHAAIDAVSSPPPGDEVTLPLALPRGRGQHPYERWPVYGLEDVPMVRPYVIMGPEAWIDSGLLWEHR